MRTLIAWDDPQEADLVTLYLTGGDNEATVTLTGESFLAEARRGPWDAVLLSMTFPKTIEESFTLFQQLRQLLPEAPIVLGCRASEMIQLPRFLMHGLRFYVIRDNQGDFVFLVLSSIESAVAAERAEESKKLAERLREEMEGVRRLQESIIPQGLKPPPGYCFAARYEPAQVSVVGDRPVVMAGGDYYDLFCPDEHTLIVLIGDASGHGLKACMSIMAMHTLIRMFPGDRYRDTSAFVTEVNQRLCENSIVQSGGGFITLLYASIDTLTHKVNWTSAGHPLALLQNLATNEVTQVGTDADGGLPLGITPGIDYTSANVLMPSNSRLLLYSDGLPDAMPLDSADHRAFGVRGVIESLKAGHHEPVDAALDRLFRASNDFTGKSGRHDDTSVVLLERIRES
jgi:sigma-B regulation protein RsbU (phosphoserine phosphatase)